MWCCFSYQSFHSEQISNVQPFSPLFCLPNSPSVQYRLNVCLICEWTDLQEGRSCQPLRKCVCSCNCKKPVQSRARKYLVLWLEGMLELLQNRGGWGWAPYERIHFCLFIILNMPSICICARVEWISNVRWKHMRVSSGWRWEAQSLWWACFSELEVGGVCACARACLWCFWHEHMAGTTNSSPATWSIIYPNMAEHSLPTTWQRCLCDWSGKKKTKKWGKSGDVELEKRWE